LGTFEAFGAKNEAAKVMTSRAVKAASSGAGNGERPLTYRTKAEWRASTVKMEEARPMYVGMPNSGVAPKQKGENCKMEKLAKASDHTQVGRNTNAFNDF
jgi:hypothetical protein